MYVTRKKTIVAASLLLVIAALLLIAYRYDRTNLICRISGWSSLVGHSAKEGSKMDRSGGAPVLPWHALFAPLPDKAVPRRQSVAPPEILAKPEAAAIAGWTQLVMDLSAGCGGNRVIMVVLDAGSRPISASDAVLYRSVRLKDHESVIEYRHESVGGRIEADGTFRGTRWRSVTLETKDGRRIRGESTPSEPSESDVGSMKALVAEMVHRAPR